MTKQAIHTLVSILLVMAIFGLQSSVTYAQSASFAYVTGFANSIIAVLVLLVPIIMALGLAVFIWGLVLFIKNADNETARTEARQKMVWGVVGLFMMVSLWGFVYLVQQLTGVSGPAGSLSAPDAPSAQAN